MESLSQRKFHRYSNGAYHPGRHDTYRMVDHIADEFTLFGMDIDGVNSLLRERFHLTKIPKRFDVRKIKTTYTRYSSA